MYEKRGHKVGKDLYEAKNTTRALSVELKMVARSATIQTVDKALLLQCFAIVGTAFLI